MKWNPCLCGCGYKAGRWRNYKPGHDQKLRADLEARVGGLVNLKYIVESHLALKARLGGTGSGTPALVQRVDG